MENLKNFKKKKKKIFLLKKFIKILKLLKNFENLEIEKKNYFEFKKFLNNLENLLNFENLENIENFKFFEILKKKFFFEIEKIKNKILFFLQNSKISQNQKNFEIENFEFSDFSLLSLKSYYLLNYLKWIFFKKFEISDFIIFEKIVKNSNLKIYFSAAEKIFLKKKNSKNENLAFFKFLKNFKIRINFLLKKKEEKIFIYFFINEFFIYQFLKQNFEDEKNLLSIYLKNYFEIIIENFSIFEKKKNFNEKKFFFEIKNFYIKNFGKKIENEIFFDLISNLNNYISKINFFEFCEKKKIMKINFEKKNEIENFYFKEIKFLFEIFFLNFEKFSKEIFSIFENLQIFFNFFFRNEKKIFLISEKFKISNLLLKINNFFLEEINFFFENKKKILEILEKDFFENSKKINKIFFEIEKKIEKFFFNKFYDLIQNPDLIFKIDKFFENLKKEKKNFGFDFSEISKNEKFLKILENLKKKIFVKLEEEIKLNIHQKKKIKKKFSEFFKEILN